tara:strand:+ start:372 stop:1259 length:888 start_codon:yes stop_codon:yes gene_type:complete
MMNNLLDSASFTTESLFWISIIIIFLAAFIAGYLSVKNGRKFYGEYEEVFKDTATTNMEDMFLFFDPQRLFLFNIVALIIFPTITLLLFGGISAIVVFFILLVGPFQIYKGMRKRRLKAFERQLPEALTMVSGSLAAGASLNMAMEALIKDQPAPLSQEFMLFIREQRIGVEFEHSLREMERRLPIPDFIMFTAALRISREIGGNLGETLDTLAETLRRKATMEGKIESLTAQGRMQGYVMTALPIFLGIILYFLEPEAMGMLFTTPAGWGTVTLIFVMEVIGYVFIKKVTNINV